MGGAGFSVLQADFARWKNLSKVVSLDAWLLNEDRNMGNLVRMGVGRYALIDHGRICTGNHWAVPIDRARMKHTNKLALVAWGNADIDSAPNQARASILQACDGHSSAYMLSLPALQRWFVDLIQEDESKDAQGFFAERSGSVGRHLRTAYGVLI